MYRLLSNPYLQVVCLLVAVEVALSGKFDVAGTSIALTAALLIGSFGIISHRSRRPSGRYISGTAILIYAGALVLFGRYLEWNLRRLASKHREEFVRVLQSQSEPREAVKIGCPSNDEQTCVFAGNFLNLFKVAEWPLQFDSIKRLNLPKPLSGVALFKHGTGGYDPSLLNSGLWVQETPSLTTIQKAFAKIGMKAQLQKQADVQMPNNLIGVCFGVEP